MSELNLVIETFVLNAQPEQVSAARRWAAKVLDGHPRADDAVLAVSELTSNAILHSRSGQGGGGTIEVTIAANDTMARVYVIDEGSVTSVPHITPQCQPDCGSGGRGLAIVAVLASRWGYQPGIGGCMTWCELAAS